MNTSLEKAGPDSSEPQRAAAPGPHGALGTALAALKPVMHQAFVLTTQGVPAKTIAEEVGVTRATLHNWKKYNPKFRAALNAWHQDQVQSIQLGVVAILPEAFETIRKDVKHNSNLAFKVVDKAGGFAPPPTGCISPKQVRQQIKLELRREKLRIRKQEEKLHLQIVNQRAQELEDKIEADRIEKLRKMDPAEVNRIREFNATVEELANELHENTKYDPDFKFDQNYVRGMLYPEEHQKEKLKEIEENTTASVPVNARK